MIKATFTEARAFEEPPNTWKRVFFKDDNQETALYTCPNGHSGLLDEHQISSDGTVSPSIICTECDFHDFVKLVGW